MLSKKGCMGNDFAWQLQEDTQGGTKENTTLVHGRNRTTLNDACYNCRNPSHLAYNFSEACRTGKCYLQVIYIFAQNKIQQNNPINKNWVLLETYSSASVLKNVSLEKNV